MRHQNTLKSYFLPSRKWILKQKRRKELTWHEWERPNKYQVSKRCLRCYFLEFGVSYSVRALGQNIVPKLVLKNTNQQYSVRLSNYNGINYVCPLFQGGSFMHSLKAQDSISIRSASGVDADWESFIICFESNK